MTSQVNITKKRGDNKRITFTIQSSNRTPINITAWTGFQMAINTEKTPVDATNQVATQIGTISDGPNGKVFFPVDNTIAVGTYYYDMQGVDENGEISTLVEGKYIVNQDITKS